MLKIKTKSAISPRCICIIVGILILGLVVTLVYVFGIKLLTGTEEINEDNLSFYTHNNDTLIFTTVLGRKQMYRLGKYLRRRYKNLVSEYYSRREVYVYSADTDRAIMSGQAAMAGMFPPTRNETWTDELPWQPIPVRSVALEHDILFRGGKPCPKYSSMYTKYMVYSPEAQEFMQKYKDQILYWSKMSGRNLKRIDLIADLYKDLMTEDDWNEDWVKDATQLNGPMENITKIVHKFRGLPELVRLRAGFMLKELLERTAQKTGSTLDPDRLFWMYSSHSSNVIPLLNGLGIYELDILPYSSTLHFELYKTSENEYYLQFFYRKPGEKNPLPLEIPVCGIKWTLKQFYKVYEKILPGDFDTECEL